MYSMVPKVFHYSLFYYGYHSELTKWIALSFHYCWFPRNELNRMWNNCNRFESFPFKMIISEQSFALFISWWINSFYYIAWSQSIKAIFKDESPIYIEVDIWHANLFLGTTSKIHKTLAVTSTEANRNGWKNSSISHWRWIKRNDLHWVERTSCAGRNLWIRNV